MYTIKPQDCEQNYCLKHGFFMSNTDIPRNWTHKKAIIIPFGTTKIGYQVFINCHNLNSISIPNTITTIGGSAFQWCVDLQEIIIPDSVTRIENGAFSGCRNLKHVYFGKNSKLEYIGDNCFANCNLESIELPKSLKTIGIDAFKNCCPLQKIVMTAEIYDKYFKRGSLSPNTTIGIYQTVDIETLKKQVKSLWIKLKNEGTVLTKPDVEHLPQKVLEDLITNYNHILKCVVAINKYADYYNREYLNIEDFDTIN